MERVMNQNSQAWYHFSEAHATVCAKHPVKSSWTIWESDGLQPNKLWSTSESDHRSYEATKAVARKPRNNSEA